VYYQKLHKIYPVGASYLKGMSFIENIYGQKMEISYYENEKVLFNGNPFSTLERFELNEPILLI
jgi:hypothetical protein